MTLWPASAGCGSGSGINAAIGALSHRIATLAAVTNDPDAGCVIAAADAVGAPLSELSRLLMQHEPTMTVTVPGWVADRVACAARLWGVCVPVAGAWLLAEGTSRLVRAADADRLDLLTENIPALNITDPDSSDDCRQMQVPTPGTELFVALGWLAKLAKAHIRHVAAVGVAWGVARLHHTEDGHDCSTATSADIEPRPEPADGAALGAYEAGVLAGVPLEQLALSLLAPKQILAVALPAFVDDWLVCIARRWQTTESTTAVWLLAEGAGYLYALEDQGDTAWRTGPNRWVIPEGTTGPQRLIEIPGELLQTTVGSLASRRGDDQTGIVTLAVGVGARMWLDDHGCACGERHSPGAGLEPPADTDAPSGGPPRSPGRLRHRWLWLRSRHKP